MSILVYGGIVSLMKPAKKFPKYDHTKIEKKWQSEWEKKRAFKAKDNSKKPKFYGLIEFPYPSGDGLHVGHIRSNTAMDIIARKRRAEGFEVLYPIGWDAFGLPTENYAIKTGVAPQVVTKKNTDTFRRQLKSLGFSFDWDREINTTDPEYYKWTQWIFLQLFKKGLAYKKKMAINWCPKDKIGLANEEVIDGKCERCGTEVEQREKEQWMLAITKYADRLDKDLDTVDFLEKIKIQQRNWIGKSEGSEIDFQIKGSGGEIKVFTTRADTLFGATYLVLSPEHLWVTLACDDNHKNALENQDEVEKYVAEAKKKDITVRTAADKEKTGVELKGVKAINPANGEEIPVFVADYVLADYGTGAIMAVPAHDERDFTFAKKYNVPIKEVVEPLLKKESGADAVRTDEPLKERRAAVAVIKHWSDDSYLCLRWKKNGWQGFVIGGIEDGESAQKAAEREVAEETGYKNLTYKKTLGGVIHSQFYQATKEVNRFAHFEAFLFELTDGTREEIAEREKTLHDAIWVPKKEVDAFLNREDMKLIWHRAMDESCYSGFGILVNSGEFSGMSSTEAAKKITEKVGGKVVTTYKLRDWVFSRQRYWGEPIPLVFCDACKKRADAHHEAHNTQHPENAGWVAVPEKDLPVKLPKVEKYQPTDTGESPLAAIEKWVNTKCPVCGGKARRETDTMPNWAGSSWYYLRYCDPHNKKVFADKKKLAYWSSSDSALKAKNYNLEAGQFAGPVDWYNGGMEHTTLHLLYSRFWHKFLFDEGLVPTPEPYTKRTSHGLILAEGGVKMSKSKGNVVNPDAAVKTVGADALRLYEMFMGPFGEPIVWSEDGVVGTRRFIERVWRFVHASQSTQQTSSKEIKSLLNDTIKKVSDDIEAMRFNTAVSALMTLLNAVEKEVCGREECALLVKLISPFAPHVAEELWAILKERGSVHEAPWPVFDPAKAVFKNVRLAVQIDKKVRATFSPAQPDDEKSIIDEALLLPEVKKWTERTVIKKVLVIKGKIVSIVTK